MSEKTTRRVPLAPLLSAPSNASRLEAIIRNESANPVSALNRYKRMQTSAPAIVLAADRRTILDGLHRALVAESRGQTEIEAHP
jgi:hypothetical protein